MFSNSKILIVATFVFVILFLRFFQIANLAKPPVDKVLKFKGKVSSEPVNFGQSQYFSVNEFKIRTKIFPQYHYGDVLEIKGTPNGNSLISYPEIKKIGELKGVISAILNFRRFLLDKASQIWPEPESSLLTGVILGQDTISAEIRQSLINTGTIHIVVVSGQNLTMLSGFLIGILQKFFKRRTTTILVIGVIFFYTILTGFQPPTVRAAIMGSLAFLANFIGRENWGFWALGLTAALMLLAEPKLISDISFQLSFAATFGILFGTPLFEKIFSKLPKIFAESLAITIPAWIFTAPLIGFYFSKFTPITPLSNLLVVPVVPFLMITGVLSLAISQVSLFLGKLFALIPFAASAYFTLIIENLSKFPFATISLGQLNIFLIASFYVFIILAISWSQRKFVAKI